MTIEADAEQVWALVRAITPLLTGKPAAVQGAVLADLLALWLAGHVAPGNPEATRIAREEILAMHIDTVWRLVDVSYRKIIEPKLRKMGRK